MKSAEGTNHLVVNRSSKEYLLIIAKWTRFLSNLGFITAGLLFLLMFVAIRGWVETDNGVSGLPMLVWVICIIVQALLADRLATFSRGVKSSMMLDDSDELSIAFGSLKSYFRIVGVINVLVLVRPILSMLGLIFDALLDSFNTLLNN